jgi:glycosyltransferase involved in cell wall biosynthesis
MVLTFTWPSTVERAGGVTALYEFANAMARRGHEVHFVHGPAWPGLITSVDQLRWFRFEPSVTHHVVETFSADALPVADVAFHPDLPGPALPATVVQGFRMVPLELERLAYLSRGPKVCVSSWLVDLGRRFGVPAARLWHVPMGLDHERFAVRVAAADRAYDVAMWENPHPSKGSHVGWQVLAAAREAVPGLRAVVFSHAALRPDSARRAEAMPWVDVRVGLDQAGLAAEVYDQARTFLQPSYVEGFGFTAVEAMACGAALVTTANGGARDYAFDGETALVRPVGDVRGLTDALVGAVTDDALRSRLAAAGERHVRRFDWDEGARILEGHLDAYLADPEPYLAPPEFETAPDHDPSVELLGGRP